MAEEGPPGERRRVLFVDDEPLVIRSLRRTLGTRSLSWEPCFAETGAEALSLADKQGIDVVVSDMHMPGMDGAALLRRIQERHPEVVRIILSGQTDRRLVFRAVPVAHQFLTKPFDSSLLVATIERALEFRSLVASPSLRAALGAENRLPSAPKVYSALTRILSSEDASLSQIVELIERDPALAARVMQLGSSSFFRVPNGVRGLSGIVSYLGVDIIKTLILTVEIVGVFGMKTGVGDFSLETFQNHSVHVAHIARRILERGDQAEDAFLAGVLHDVGRLVLVSRRPAMMTKAIETASRNGTSLHRGELDALGVTHAEVGAYLLGIWGLPLDIVDAVLLHHGTERSDRHLTSIARAVFIADRLAHDPDASLDSLAPTLSDPSEGPADDGWLASLRNLAREMVGG
jgi:HD-like signal output (HDOD) protein/CheY-like chemotaxis protein